MRSYENSGYNPYNDNYRLETRGSARNYYSDDYGSSRNLRGSYGSGTFSGRSGGFGSGRDAYESSGYGNTSTYGRSAGSSGYGSGSNRRYGSSDWDSSNRYGDRDAWDRGTDEVRSWFGDDDAERRRRMDEMRERSSDNYRSNRGYSGSSNLGSSSNYGGTGYGSTMYGAGSGFSTAGYSPSSLGSSSLSYGPSYGSNYGSPGYGSSDYSSNRYSSGDWDRDRDRDNDRGFFDRAGDEVKSWFGDEEAERRRRMDEMRDRSNDSDDYNSSYRSHTSYGNTYSGPPYSYGSSSRRDYEW